MPSVASISRFFVYIHSHSTRAISSGVRGLEDCFLKVACMLSVREFSGRIAEAPKRGHGIRSDGWVFR